MKSTFDILFYLKRQKKLSRDGKHTIMCKITMNGEETAFSLKLKIPEEIWDQKDQKATGKSEEAIHLNYILKDTETSLRSIYRDLINSKESKSVIKIKIKYFGLDEKNSSLLTLFNDHNQSLYELVKADEKSLCTYEKYQLTLKRLLEFLKIKRNGSKDIELESIDNKFIRDFDNFLRTEIHCSNDVTGKYLQRLKKIMQLGVMDKIIDSNPFDNFKIKMGGGAKQRKYLTNEEIMRIMEKDFISNRLEELRDCFIFSCFTGLSYVELNELTQSHICNLFDGKEWIDINRKKTSGESLIPLLHIPLLIIKKYEDKLPNGKILPTKSNQKMNEYLKEIATLCDIPINLTCHVARHTFATTICMDNGISLESVAKMLGQERLRTTKLYAHTTERRISSEVENIIPKLDTFNSIFQFKMASKNSR